MDRFHPAGKFVIYYDANKDNYFSYEVASGRRRNITASIHTDWTVYGDDFPNARMVVEGPMAWVEGDVGVVLYDQNDIWIVDPTAWRKPANLTNGYGRRHNITFRLVEGGRGTIVAKSAPVMLSAFNRNTKDNGYYRKSMGKVGDPTLLTMGPYVYDLMDVGGAAPLKAKRAEAYLVSRESASEFKNVFFTTDFKTFTSLSNVHPERKLNWLTTELVEWKLPNGTLNQGVLYKPENFDPKKDIPGHFLLLPNSFKRASSV